MPTHLPTELIVDIIEIHFEGCIPPTRVGRSSALEETKPPWSQIRAVLLTSHAFRAIGLRLWFIRLRVRCEWNWEYMSRIPGIYTWIRMVSYHNITSILIPDIHPANFPFLRCVSIRMLDTAPIRVINRLPASVKCLEIWKFDTMVHDQLFSAIAAQLPDLQELRLHGMGEVDKYGLGTHFESVDTFGKSMAISLSKLQKLEVLIMDVYLTPSTVLLYHASCPRDQPLVSCGTCIQKFSNETRANEAGVSLLVAIASRNLKKVEWSSCFSWRHRSTLLIKRDEVDSVVSIEHD